MGEIGILTVEETERLFRANEKIDPEVCGLMALGLFAGMRTSAIPRVEYEEIRMRQGILTPAEKTKKNRRNYIENLPDNFWLGWNGRQSLPLGGVSASGRSVERVHCAEQDCS